MSQERKTLKIVCFALAVVALVALVLDVMALVNQGAGAEPLGIAGAVATAVAAVAGFAVVARGIAGANTPRKAGAVRVPAAAAGVLGAAGAVMEGMSSQVALAFVAVLICALAVCAGVFGAKVLEQAQR